jgi:hypothetical protein
MPGRLANLGSSIRLLQNLGWVLNDEPGSMRCCPSLRRTLYIHDVILPLHDDFSPPPLPPACCVITYRLYC